MLSMRVRLGLKAMLAAGLVCWVSAAGALDQFSKGDYYLRVCKGFLSEPLKATVSGEQGVCLGAVGTLMDASRLFASDLRFCVPAGVTHEQAIRIVVSSLEAQPQRQKESFVELALEALRKEWPCKASQ
jgi:Rap1a immunity proteins